MLQRLMGAACAHVYVWVHTHMYSFLAGMCTLSNPGLRELPPELGQLGNLWQLDTEDLSISNVPAEIRKEGMTSVSCPQSITSLSPLKKKKKKKTSGPPARF